MPSWRRYPGRFTIILLSAAALFLALEAINGRLWLNDFRVYYEAAGALVSGGSPYGVAHGLSSGFFKYAPAMACLYAPLALLPYPLAAGIQFALIVLALHGALLITDELVRSRVLPGSRAAYVPLFLALLIAGAHVHRELHLGNINLLLLLLLLGGLRALLNDRRRLAGLLWGLAVLAKPHFAVLLPWLVLRSEWAVMRWMAVSIALGVVLPLPFVGIERWATLHGAWLHAMASHNATLVYTGGDEHQMVDTAYSFVYRAFLGQLGCSVEATVLLVLSVVAVAMGLLVLRNRQREGAEQRSGNLVQEAFIIIALVPSLTVTDTNHFLFALPLVLLLLQRIRSSTRPVWLIAAAVPVLLAHGGNWSDALGAMSGTLTHYGVLGIANLALVILGYMMLTARLNPPQASPSNRPSP